MDQEVDLELFLHQGSKGINELYATPAEVLPNPRRAILLKVGCYWQV